MGGGGVRIQQSEERPLRPGGLRPSLGPEFIPLKRMSGPHLSFMMGQSSDLRLRSMPFTGFPLSTGNLRFASSNLDAFFSLLGQAGCLKGVV